MRPEEYLLGDDILMAGGPEDDYDDEEGDIYDDDDEYGDIELMGDADIEDYLDDYGDSIVADYDPETGLAEIGGRRRRRGLFGKGSIFRKLGRLTPFGALQRRATKKRRKRKKKKAAAMVAMAQRTASTTIAGARFIMAKGCTLAVPPIPIETRVPVHAAKAAFMQAALHGPFIPPVHSDAKVAGQDAYAILDPDTLFNLTAAVFPSGPSQSGPGNYMPADEFMAKGFAIRIDIGLPGVNASAGVPVSFDLFTYHYGVELMPNARVFPWGTIYAFTGGAIQKPAPFRPVPEADLNNTFASGQFIINPNSIASAASILVLPWRVSQGIPQPKLIEISAKYEQLIPTSELQGIPAYPPPDPIIDQVTSALWHCRGMAARLTSAPVGSTIAMTFIGPTHPEWNELLSLLGGTM